MKKFLQVIGALVYGVVVVCLLELFFDWVTPMIVTLSGWEVVVFYAFILEIMISLMYVACMGLTFLALRITKDCLVAKIVYALLFVPQLILCVRLPWIGPIDYGFIQVILAITVTLLIVVVCVALPAVPFFYKEE